MGRPLPSYKVVVDGQLLGEVWDGEELTVPVAPGDRRVELKIDWTGSAPVHLVVELDDVELTVEWTGNLFSRDGYLRLRRNGT